MTRDDTVAKLGEVIEAVHAEGALAGVHCCGNTEWPILIDAGVDILNFDAFDYGDTILLYPDNFQGLPESRQAIGFRNCPHQQRQDPRPDGRLAYWPNFGAGGEAGQGDRVGYAVDLPSVLHYAVMRHWSLPVADAELVFKTLHETSANLRQEDRSRGARGQSDVKRISGGCATDSRSGRTAGFLVAYPPSKVGKDDFGNDGKRRGWKNHIVGSHSGLACGAW